MTADITAKRKKQSVVGLQNYLLYKYGINNDISEKNVDLLPILEIKKREIQDLHRTSQTRGEHGQNK